jgi:hypothetical protein
MLRAEQSDLAVGDVEAILDDKFMFNSNVILNAPHNCPNIDIELPGTTKAFDRSMTYLDFTWDVGSDMSYAP